MGSSLLPTTAEPPSTIVMVSEEETEGEGGEGEAAFDTSLDEACEEVIEKQTSMPEEEEEPELTAGALSIVIGGTSAPSGPSSICEDSDMTDTAISAGTVEGKVEKSDQVGVTCSPRDTQSEAKREKDSGMVMVNDSWFSLDLVALICYSKLKQKCPGWLLGLIIGVLSLYNHMAFPIGCLLL